MELAAGLNFQVGTLKIESLIAAARQKQPNEHWKIMQEMQTKIFEITQDVPVNKARAANNAVNAFDGYIPQRNDSAVATRSPWVVSPPPENH